MSFIFVQPAALAEGVIPVAAPDAETSPAETETITLSKEEAALYAEFAALMGFLREYHTRELSYGELYEGAVSGVLASLKDRYSQHFTAEQLESWVADLEGQYGGLGVTLELIDTMITVVSVYPRTPAEKEGLKAGDILMAVGDVDMVGKMPADAALLLRGDPDTAVGATFLRPSTGEMLQMTFVRETITPPTMDVQDMGEGLFYVSIATFNENVQRNLPVVLDIILDGRAEGIVLDLRNNPGGLLDACVEIADRLVPKGPVVELRRKDLKETIENPNEVDPVPVVVLVNGGSASASEILAGAIRDRGAGVLVGETTFGKGSVQTVIELGEGLGAAKITIAEYFTPSGFALNGKGLTPDYPVTPERVAIPQPPVYSRPLKRGVIGLDVLAAQECLAFLDYGVGEPDGIFGPLTDAAMTAFCRKYGLQYSGAVTEEHMRFLGTACAQKVKDAGDFVKDRGIEILRNRLETGHWE